jgi:hypothetical protein
MGLSGSFALPDLTDALLRTALDRRGEFHEPHFLATHRCSIGV